MGKIRAIVAKEVREALPAAIFFLLLFHLLALTKAVTLNDYSVTALRAVTATVAAIVVAKAILVVEALPISRLLLHRGVLRALWKTLLYSIVVLVFRLVEEVIPLAVKRGDLLSGVKAMGHEVSWPLFAVMTLWVACSLFLYALAAELVHAIGPGRVREMLFGHGGARPED